MMGFSISKENIIFDIFHAGNGKAKVGLIITARGPFMASAQLRH